MRGVQISGRHRRYPKVGGHNVSLKTGQPSAKLMVQAWFTMFALRLYSHEERAPEFPRSWSSSLFSCLDRRPAKANRSSSSSESSVSSGLPPCGSWGWKNLHFSPLEALGCKVCKVLDNLFVLSKYMQVLLVHWQSDQSDIKKNRLHKKGKRKVLLALLIARCSTDVHSTVLWCTCPSENASKAAAAAAKHLGLSQLLVVQKVIGKTRQSQIYQIQPMIPNSDGGLKLIGIRGSRYLGTNPGPLSTKLIKIALWKTKISRKLVWLWSVIQLGMTFSTKVTDQPTLQWRQHKINF